MVSNASALGRNGIQDWLLLRATAILITLYIVYILGFVVMTDTLTYDLWRLLCLRLHQSVHAADAVLYSDPRLDWDVAGVNRLR